MTLNNRFNNKVVVISGAGNGIGAACAIRISKEDGKIVLLDYNEKAIQEVCSKIVSAGGHAIAIPCDITNKEQIDAALHEVLMQWGHIDVLINNAGVHRYDHFLELEMNDFDWVMNTNVKGNVMLTQAFLPHIKDSEGSVVNVASTAGLGNHAYSTAYAASGGAIIALTKALTNEFGKEGVNFNVVCPGNVATQMWSDSFEQLPSDFEPRLLVKSAPFSKQPQTAEETAGVIAFLASAEGKHLNGSVITADGGSMA